MGIWEFITGQSSASMAPYAMNTRAGTNALLAREQRLQGDINARSASMAAGAYGSNAAMALREGQRMGAQAGAQLGASELEQQRILEQNAAAANQAAIMRAREYNANVQQENDRRSSAGLLGAVATVGGIAAMASDKKAKEDIRPTMYSDYRYKEGPAAIGASVTGGPLPDVNAYGQPQQAGSSFGDRYLAYLQQRDQQERAARQQQMLQEKKGQWASMIMGIPGMLNPSAKQGPQMSPYAAPPPMMESDYKVKQLITPKLSKEEAEKAKKNQLYTRPKGPDVVGPPPIPYAPTTIGDVLEYAHGRKTLEQVAREHYIPPGDIDNPEGNARYALAPPAPPPPQKIPPLTVREGAVSRKEARTDMIRDVARGYLPIDPDTGVPLPLSPRLTPKIRGYIKKDLPKGFTDKEIDAATRPYTSLSDFRAKEMMSAQGAHEALAPVRDVTYRYRPDAAVRMAHEASLVPEDQAYVYQDKREPRRGIIAQDLEKSPAFKGSVVNSEVGKKVDMERAMSTNLAATAGLEKRQTALEQELKKLNALLKKRQV